MLPRECISKYGRELTFKERINSKVYGIGFFKPIKSEENVLSQLFKVTNNTVRPHLDQLTCGLIFRLTRTNEINALAIHFDEIKKVQIIKLPDQVSPIPLSPFWFLLKIGFKAHSVQSLAKYNEFRFGDVTVEITLTQTSSIKLRWNGRFVNQLTKFFNYSLGDRTETNYL